MKTKLTRFYLLVVFPLLFAATVQLPAQNTNTANAPSWADTQPVSLSGTNANQATTEATNNNQEIITLIRNAAEHGDADAQNNLGWIYLNGYGVSKNVDEAIKWLTKSAQNGNLQAAGRLAAHYFFDMGEYKNIQEGMRWYRFGAERGDISSQRTLGLILREGGFDLANITIEKDPNEAAKWYLRAAKQGDGDAQIKIGEMYAEGEGVSQNFVEAFKWFNIAAASPKKPAAWSVVTATNREALKLTFPPVAQKAKNTRDNLIQQMTPDQIAEGQRLSAAFVPRKETSGSTSDNSISSDSPTATGTGFFITDDGYLISNYHVVKDAAQVRLLTRAGTIPAKVVQVDEANDIALLKAEGRFAPLPIASSRTVKLGGTVATVGFPDIGLQGFAPKLAKGEIASLSGAGDSPRYFQISVPVQPGNSGGALVDERGNVVGIVSAKLSARAALAESGALPENVNYAVKSSFILGFLESVPDVSAKLKEPVTADRKFEDVVKSAQQAAVLVLVY
jgi:hypothetical protein